MSGEEISLEGVDKKVRAIFISIGSFDGSSRKLGKDKIVRRLYPLIDISKIVESQKEDKRKLIYLKDIRSRIRGLNARMQLRPGDLSVYTGTKAKKNDIISRDKVIKELKTIQQDDLNSLLKSILTVAIPLSAIS